MRSLLNWPQAESQTAPIEITIIDHAENAEFELSFFSTRGPRPRNKVMRTEFRYALRSLLRDRAFTMTKPSVLVALGIGANRRSLVDDGILCARPTIASRDRMVRLRRPSRNRQDKTYPV